MQWKASFDRGRFSMRIAVVATLMVVVAGMASTTAPGLIGTAAAQGADPSCGADVAMVVDSSGSVDAVELGQMQDAFAGFVAAFLPATPTEMAVVDFDRQARVLETFTDDAAALDAALNSIESGGRTNWQDGLLKARELFPNRDAPDIIVFASDGRPNKVNGSNEFNRKAALEAAIVEADAAKAAGARIIAIGIGDRLRVDKLEAIASSPADVHTTDFDTLADTLADLADDLCPPADPSCGTDMAMVVDSSGSVDAVELGQMQDAFAGFVAASLPATPTEMAVVDFDRQARVLQPFTDDASSLDAALAALESGGRTNWQDALLKARELFPHRDVPDVIVFASDGRPNKVNGSNEFNRKAALEAAIVEADAAKAAGARIIAIGIGDRLRVDKLEAIASSPADVYTADFDTLADTLADLADDLCGGTITVTKLIDADGDLGTVEDQTPAEGWTFAVTVGDGSADPVTGVTGVDGTVVLSIAGPGAIVDVTETLIEPFALLSAECTGGTENGTSNGIDAVTGVVVGADDAVSCVFVNASEGGGS